MTILCTDTGFYYLNARYYDPETGRFINADGYASTGQGFVGSNMFAYCNNNPVMYADYTESYVIGIGITASGGAVFGGSVGGILVIDGYGNVGIIWSADVPICFPGASITGLILYSWRDSIYDLEGADGYIGGSGGEGLVGDLDVLVSEV